MKNDCTIFLQWVLPHMKMRWAGFRKVRNQVCKRIRHRMKQLNLQDFKAYKSWIKDHDSEWDILDAMCTITISRFYRDWAVFNFLRDNILSQLTRRAKLEDGPLRCWSASCASGEEPYTLSLIWNFFYKEEFYDVDLQIIATDKDEQLLSRAKIGCYTSGSLKALPKQWLDKGFSAKGNEYCIHPQFGKNIEWIQQDIRILQPSGVFDLVLFRNLIATYFEPSLQVKLFNNIRFVLRPGGYIVLGCHEQLPEKLNIYVKDQ